MSSFWGQNGFHRVNMPWRDNLRCIMFQKHTARRMRCLSAPFITAGSLECPTPLLIGLTDRNGRPPRAPIPHIQLAGLGACNSGQAASHPQSDLPFRMRLVVRVLQKPRRDNYPRFFGIQREQILDRPEPMGCVGH